MKVQQSAKLILASSSSRPPASRRIRIVPTDELPPAGNGWKTSVPRMFALEQNYPDSFNPTTTIRYQLPVDSRVVLKIFDLLGRIDYIAAFLRR